MRISVVLFSILLLSSLFFAQEPEPTATPVGDASAVQKEEEDSKSVFESAAGEKDLAKRERALVEFLENHPGSEPVLAARELLTATRAEIAAAAFKSGDRDEGLRLFRLALTEAPSPVSDRLFTGVLLTIPNSLYFGGLREAGFEFAGTIEKKVGENPRQLLGIATFYLAVEDSQNARRLSEKAISLAPEDPSGYQTLGVASRLGFDLVTAEQAYSKALELDPASLVSKRSLAEIKRAVGKPEEAVRLYDEIISADPSDASAGTGRTLALYDAGRLEEAESAKDTLLAVNPKNFVLLVGTAYWYAAHGQPEKAVSHANAALAVEPRYTWAHIALARGLVETGRPLDAERILLGARQFGNFPTLEYELAAARLSAGFFRDAFDALTNTFSVSGGELKAMLGGRVEKKADNFTDLLALERQASIYEPSSADDPQSAERLKRLLNFITVLESGNEPEDVALAAEQFIEGADPMKTHRQMFAAERLLDKRIALAEAAKITADAVAGVDESLNVPAPVAAVLADQLYESRKLAIVRGTLVVVPEIPRQTLARVLRGRIEELSGWANFLQGENEQAEIHLKRALSILPRNSAWSRSAHWRMGTVLETAGRQKDALDSYIAGYRGGGEDPVKKIVVEGLYNRLNGNLDGLEERLKEVDEEPSTLSRFVKEGEKPEPSRTSVIEDTTGNGDPSKPGEAAKIDAGVAGTELPQETKVEEIPADTVLPTDSVASEDPELKTDDQANATKDPVGDASGDKTAADTASEKEDAEPKADDDGKAAEVVEPVPDKTSDPAKPVGDDSSIQPVPENAVPAADADDKREPSDPGEGSAVETTPGTTRPRRVPQQRTRLAEDKQEAAACSLVLSQESVVITSNGGSAGVLAGIEGSTGVFSLKAVSSSPQNVSVTVDSAAAEIAGRAVFVIRSVTSEKGVFAVTFQSSCGSKDVRVTVR